MSHYSKISICNVSLNLLGADSIRDFDENNKRARSVDVMYEPSKNYLLARFDWPFARGYKNLQQLDLSSEDVPPGFKGYQLPADCVTPRDLHPRGGRDKWEVSADRIFVPDTVISVGLYYTKEHTEPGKFSDTFANLLSMLIAVKVGPSITQDKKLINELFTQYQVDARDAWESDANIGNTYREYNEDPNNDTFVYPPGTGPDVTNGIAQT